MIATKRLINSVWTMEFEITHEGKVQILSYGRDNPKGAEQEHTAPKLKIVEDEHRTVTGVWIDYQYYTVSNPKHIFDYGV